MQYKILREVFIKTMLTHFCYYYELYVENKFKSSILAVALKPVDKKDCEYTRNTCTAKGFKVSISSNILKIKEDLRNNSPNEILTERNVFMNTQ